MSDNLFNDILKDVSKQLAERKEAFILEQGNIMLQDTVIIQKINLRLREIHEARQSDFVDINNKIQSFKRDEERKVHGEFFYGILFAIEKINGILEEVLLKDGLTK